MFEFMLALMPIALMVLAIEGGPRLCKIARDRRIDREISDSMWSA